jgi:hypothetical protein
MKITLKNGSIAALTSAMLFASGAVLAQNEDEVGLEHLVIEMATTSAQHHAVAEHYTAKAAEARQEMRRHERMARAYGVSKAGQAQQMRNHCQRLANNYEQLAAEYDELAKLHEQEATHAPQ